MLDRLSQPAPGFPLPDNLPSAYDLARRHSARVKKLKVALPVAAAVISLVFIGVSLARTWMPDEVSLESATIEDGKIVMEKPALAGRNNKGFDYSMNAERALQDITSPNLMTLEKVLAAVPMNDIVAQVVAQEGIFDRATNRLKMTAPFDINLSNGLKAQFQSADVDLKAGTMDSREPVSITTKEGSIVAESLSIADNGRTITFSGRYVLVSLHPPSRTQAIESPNHMTQITRPERFVPGIAAAILLACLAAPATAQNTTSSMEGLKLSNDQPIAIESDQLEVRDQEKKAYFTGNVKVVQGTTTLQAGKMTVLYKGGAEGQGNSITSGNADIDKIFVDNSVYLTSGSQKATADKGEFDMTSQTFTLSGKQVVLSQDTNVFTGCKLTVLMNTGEAKLESCGGPVRIMLDPKSQKKQ